MRYPIKVQSAGPGVPGDRLRRVRERASDVLVLVLHLVFIPMGVLLFVWTALVTLALAGMSALTNATRSDIG